MKNYLFIITALFSIALCSCNSTSRKKASESENSQWRGEGRDGVYHETGLLKEWPADGPQLLWKYEGLGEGYTSAAIANGKIYITGLVEDKLVLYVLDMKGQLLVEKEICEEWTKGRNGTRSTVCVNDGKLYVYSALGEFFCLDEATLEVVWKKDIFTDFDGKKIPWGVAESPLVVGEKIYLTPGGIENNMVAMNKSTGELIWSSPGEGTISAYCSPQYIDDQSVPMVVTCSFGFVIAFHAETGEKLWAFPRASKYDNNPNTPLYHNGMIFSATGDNAGAIMLRLKNGGKDVEFVWHNSEVDTQMGGAVRIGNYVYATGHQNKYWFCVDWNTGETKYKDREIASCNVISADGMLYCYSDKGTMNLVKPNPEKFELISSFVVTHGTGEHWAHPVIREGVMYLRHGNALMAYKIK